MNRSPAAEKTESRASAVFAEVETPALLLDLDRLERNITEMARRCQSHGVALRPHAKTHKSGEVAQIQRSKGAVGLTVAKLEEAEAFIDAGIEDVFVAYPVVGERKLRRLIELAQRAHISTVVDDRLVASQLSAAAAAADLTIEVLVKLDLGMHRVGVEPAGASNLCRWVSNLRSLQLRGVCIHEGNVYLEPNPDRRRALARATIRELVTLAERLRLDGLQIDIVSCGSTPSAAEVVDIPGLTEIRPGNYVYYDQMQVALGVVGEDQCALSVLATVVSRRDSTHAIIDAGSKALSLDRGVHSHDLLKGFGRIIDRPGVELVGLSEEHGWLQTDPASTLAIGDRVKVLPNHACTAVANFDEYAVTSGDRVIDRWPVSARGCLT